MDDLKVVPAALSQILFPRSQVWCFAAQRPRGSAAYKSLILFTEKWSEQLLRTS
jgi:hypothetical protein